MVERAGGPPCLRSRATRRSAGHGRGVGTTFSNPLNTVQPGGSPDVPSAGASGSGDEAGVPTQAMDSRDHSGSESMRVTPADTEPSTKPGSKPPQRARRSSAPSLVYPLRSERARPDGRDPTQLHAVHVQSTFSSHSVHIQSTYVDPRGPHGVQRRRG
jgi:hypothetical protein